MKRLLPVLLAFACAKTAPELPAGIQTRVALSQATSCDELARNIQDTAVRQMRAQMDGSRDWLLRGTGTSGGADAVPAAFGGPASYSTTNTQVAGVDEADFVKNDGTRIFVLSGRMLYAARSWPPQDLALAGKLEIEGWPSSMFLDGDQLVIFSSIWSTTPSPMPGSPGIAATVCPMWGCSWGPGTTKITVVDVADLAAPVAKAQVYLAGSSAGARKAGSSVRLVLSDQVRWPEGIRWWPDYDPNLYQDKEKLAAAIAALENANEAIIRATPVEKWFPPGERKLPDGTVVDLPYQCGDFYVSNAPERLGLVTIATLDLAHPDAGVSRASIVGEPGVIYANHDRLYLAANHWWWWTRAGQHDWTYVHAFDIRDPARAAYLASGGVEGHVGDQFSMDEQDGYLRIATSTITWEESPDLPRSFRTLAGSRLTVLAPGGEGQLVKIGEIPSIVDNERLMAMRFIGNKGYAVTFRYVDPLVTIDLTDPAHPRKVAELTIPGFSSYLQPIDDGHLLAIGQELPLDSSGRPDWSRRALELSLFDVSDLEHPVRTAQALIGTAYAWSEALWDHHAFNWYRPDPAKPGLLAFPFSDWKQGVANWWDGFVSDARVFSVDPAGTITPLGGLGMSELYLQRGDGQWTWYYRPWVRRSVMATDQAGKTFVYAVSDAGVRVAALDNLGAPLGTALFPR